MKYTNPIIPGFHPDPSICRVGEDCFLAKGETRYLSTEVGGRFIGVYLAMYATANGQASGNAAGFDGFEYRDLDGDKL